MIKSLNELTTGQLGELKFTYQYIVRAQIADIERRKDRLDNTLDRADVDTGYLDQAKDELDRAIQNRDNAQATGSAVDAIADADAILAKAQAKYDEELKGVTVVDEIKLQVQQAEIDELQLGLQDKLDKIAAIDALLAA